MAHKKAGGSSKNGRDSKSKRLGIKRSNGMHVIKGAILVRQKGNKWWAGNGVKTGSDFTLYAIQDGEVKYYEKRKKRFDGRIYKDTFVSVS